ncbi:MAG: hypothetical protein P4L64_13515 [Caulobacteraceae bacterium]|nr:hypothetical protein [Caulobacteraceae bacterium]
MRRFGIGLALAMAAATLMGATASYAKDKDTSAAELPPLLAAGKVPCTLADSRFIGEGVGSDKIKAKYYEAACKEGLGYVLIVKEKNPVPESYDCFSTAVPGPDGKPGGLACKLPANAKPQDGLQALLAKAEHPCTIVKSRLIGSSDTRTFTEVACQDGQGYIYGFARKTGGEAPVQLSCIDPAAKDNLKCQLTDPDKLLTSVTAGLMASSGKACTVKDRRYIGATTDGTGLYEVACDSGKGYMLETTGDKLKDALDCAVAVNIAGGCTLTDSRAAETAQSALYSSLAKKAGFDCAVAKYAPFPVQGANEVVELQCSNRPDGGVGVFPVSGGKPMVYDCLRAQAEGYRCSFSKEEAVLPKLSAQLVAKGKGSCVVSGARAFGRTTSSDLVEVACADGGSGWVMEYPTYGNEPSALLNCAQAAAGGSGGCQLPTNKKK